MQTDPIQIPIEAADSNASAVLQNVQNGITGLKNDTDALATKQDNLSQTFRRSWTEINNAIGVAKQAFQAVKRVVDELVGSFVNYANQVRTLSQVTGTTAEETSRLIQLADDHKVSYENLTVAMRKMTSEGYSVTIASMAEMSDKYLELNPGLERQQFLMQNFGRAGIQFAEVMMMGSNAILAESDALSGNLILTQEAVDKAREYERAQDEMNDTLDGLKVALGGELMPLLIAFTNEITRITIASSDAAVTLGNLNPAFTTLEAQMVSGSASYAEYVDNMTAFTGSLNASELAILSATSSTMVMSEAQYEQQRALALANQGVSEATIALDKMRVATQEVAAGTEELEIATVDYGEQLSTITGFASTYRNGLEGVKTAEDNLIQAEEDLRIAREKWGEGSAQVVDARDKVIDLAMKLGDAKQAATDATNEMIAGFLQTALAADGVFNGEDMQKVLDYRLAVGLLTQEEYDAAQEALAIANNLAGIPAEVTSNVTITTRHIDIYEQVGEPITSVDGTVTRRTFASGGSFTGWGMVGDAPGGRVTPYTEYVYAPHGATVYNQAQMSGKSAPPMADGGFISRGSTVINLSYSPMISLADEYEVQQKLIPFIKRGLREAGVSYG